MLFRELFCIPLKLLKGKDLRPLVFLLASCLLQSVGFCATSLVTNFAGIGQTAYTPPDPIIAAGTNHVVMMVNSSFSIYTKTGSNVFTSTLANWFSPVNPPGTPFQPKLVYDAAGGHWIMLALASGNPRKSSYLVSVSSNSSPVGVWWLWNIDAGLDQGVASGNTADSAGLGYDDDAIYITSNQYDSHGNFQYAKVRIIAKSLFYSGSAVTWWDFWNQTDANGEGVFGWKPAQAQSSLKGNYLINTRANGSNYVTLWKITNPLNTNTGPTLTRQATLSVQPYSVPPDAAQQGTVALLNTGDCRAQEVQFQNGKLVTAITEGYNWGGGSVSAVRTLVLDPVGNAVNVDQRYGADQAWYYEPAIARDPGGNMAMVFNRSSAIDYVGAYFTAWPAGAANWGSDTILRSGQAPYGSGVNLWGAYSGAAIDPADSGRCWLYGEYAASTTQWGTWVGEVSFPNTTTNDSCGEAIALTNGISYSMNTSGATSTNDPGSVCGVSAGKGVWFSFTPTTSGATLITTCGSDFATVLQVYSGSCATLTPVTCMATNGAACPGTQASLQFNGSSGTTYLIFAGGAGGAIGNLAIAAYSPANDICAGAVPLTSGTPYSINTASAGAIGDPAPSCGSGVTKGMWFSFTPGVSGPALVTTCGSDFDTVMQVYAGSCGSLSPVACNDNNGPLCAGTQASLSFSGLAGTTYLIFAGGSGGSSGNLTIEAYSPANDICAGALPLFAGGSASINTFSAGSEGETTDICGFSVGKGVWFSFTPSSDGQATISTCGSDFPTALQIYSGTCDSLVQVDCNNGNACLGAGASVQFQATGGTPYQILAAGVGSASGNLVISNFFCQPPKFTGGFTNTFLTPTGIVVSATVFVSGTPPFNFFWFDGPLSTNTGGNPSVSFLIPLDQIPDFLVETNFSSISVNVANSCGFDGGSGGFSSPCVVCLSRGVPVTSTTTVNASGFGPNLPTSCGSIGFAAKWFDMAAADIGAADVSVSQDSATNCFVSVFAGTLPNVTAVACDKRITDRQTRIQFQTATNLHYYLVVTNGGTITNMTFGFVPQLSASRSNGQLQLRTGMGPRLGYSIEAAAALVAPMPWSNLFSATFPTNGISYVDFGATNFNRRFYRVTPGP